MFRAPRVLPAQGGGGSCEIGPASPLNPSKGRRRSRPTLGHRRGELRTKAKSRDPFRIAACIWLSPVKGVHVKQDELLQTATNELRALGEARTRNEAEVLYESLACVTIPATSANDSTMGYAVHRALRTLIEEKARRRWLPTI